MNTKILNSPQPFQSLEPFQSLVNREFEYVFFLLSFSFINLFFSEDTCRSCQFFGYTGLIDSRYTQGVEYTGKYTGKWNKGALERKLTRPCQNCRQGHRKRAHKAMPDTTDEVFSGHLYKTSFAKRAVPEKRAVFCCISLNKMLIAKDEDQKAALDWISSNLDLSRDWRLRPSIFSQLIRAMKAAEIRWTPLFHL